MRVARTAFKQISRTDGHATSCFSDGYSDRFVHSRGGRRHSAWPLQTCGRSVETEVVETNSCPLKPNLERNDNSSMSIRDRHLPGTASLVAQLDKDVLIELLDGRHLIGVLRSFDQFGTTKRANPSFARANVPLSCAIVVPFRAGNMVLEGARERHYIDREYADVPLGLYIVRGENVVFLGETVSSLLFFSRSFSSRVIISRFACRRNRTRRVRSIYRDIYEG